MAKDNLLTRLQKKVSLILLVTAMLALCQACNLLEPPVESGSVLFQDDFSRTASGWDRYSDDTYLTDYMDGGYRIAVFTTDQRLDSSTSRLWGYPCSSYGY